MRLIFAASILVISLIKTSNAYCCFRDPLMLTPKCGCSDVDTCGVVKCPKTCANTGPKACFCSQPVCSKTCGSQPVCSSTCGSQPIYVNSCDCGQSSNTCSCGKPISLGPSVCDCGLPTCSCYRDTSNVCCVCDQPSPICSCLKACDCGCRCEDMKSFIYFPEVEYPVTAIEMKPYYYGGCFTY